MAIPEGYEKLAIVGIAYKGEYAADTAYKVMNAVYYDGSTYVALRDNPTGPPAADSSNWQYLAKGFVAALLSMITATDTNGIMGTAGAEVEAQSLIDAMASKMVSEFVNNADLTQKLADYIAKSAIVQTESTATNTVPSSAYFKQVIDTQNSNLEKSNHPILYEGNWSSGAIAIDTVIEYESLIVCFGNSTFGRRELEIYKHPINSFFIGGMASVSNGSYMLLSIQIIINGTALSPGECYGVKNGTYTTSLPITRIVGGTKTIK